MAILRTTRLGVVAATTSLGLGLTFFVTHNRYTPDGYTHVKAYLPMASALLLVGVIVLLGSGRRRPDRPLWRLALLVPGLPYVLIAALSLITRGWTAMIAYGLMGLALLVAAWLPARADEEFGPDLWNLTFGTSQILIGLLMLLAPGEFGLASYDPIRPWLMPLGLSGMLGGVLLVAGQWPGLAWVSGPFRRLLGAIMPLALVGSFTATEYHSGMITWGIWTLAQVAGTRVLPIRLQGSPVTASAHWDTFPDKLERIIEVWLWILVLSVMGLTALQPTEAQAHSLPTTGFVVLASLYNILVFGQLRQRGTVQQRLQWHLTFIVLSVGLLLVHFTEVGHGFLALLALACTLGARVVDARYGYRLLAVAGATLLGSNGMNMVHHHSTLVAAVVESVMELMLLWVAAYVGIRASTEQRQVTIDLAGARAKLQREMEQQALIDQISGAIRRSLDLTAVLETAVAELGRVLGAARCEIRLDDGPDGQGLMREYRAPNVPAAGGRQCHELAVTVIGDGEPTGRILMERLSYDRPFSSEEQAFVEAVAGQLAVAVLHARVHRSLARRLAELQSQQDANARLIEILDATPDYIGMTDSDRNPLYLNRSGMELVGVQDPAQLLLSDVYPPWVQELVKGTCIPTAIRHGTWSGEAAMLTAEGEEIPISMVLIAHRAADGTLAYLSAIQRDIRVQKATEQALRESEERFRSAFDQAPIGMAILDAEGHTLQVNRALCAMLGYSREELLSSAVSDLTHPDDRRLFNGIDGISKEQVQLEKRYIHKDGHIVWGLLSRSMVRDASGQPIHFLSQVQDITERKGYEEQLKHLANYDSLTDLFNRRRFQEELEHQVAHAVSHGTSGALLFIDLDQFKYVNDTLGHHAGDELLRGVATLLRGQLRSRTDAVARLGGDEFAMILTNVDEATARAAATRILDALRGHNQVVAGIRVGSTISMGLALFPEHGTTAAELLARADLAMYQAKDHGRNRMHVYAPGTGAEARAEAKLTWEERIRDALDEDRLVLFCQPIWDLRNHRKSHCELLLRMLGKDGQLISPGLFLPVAERFGLIQSIDRWVVRQAIGQIASGLKQGLSLVVEVNLSGRCFEDVELLSVIRSELAATGIPPENLVLEITETAAIADIEHAREFVTTLKALGCRFAIDDFGSGFASFSYLKHLPVDYLKIDGSFVQNLPRDPVDQHLVRAMVEVARSLGKQTIAEFVEDEETLRLLEEFGVDYAQGYHIGRPSPRGKCPC